VKEHAAAEVFVDDAKSWLLFVFYQKSNIEFKAFIIFIIIMNSLIRKYVR